MSMRDFEREILAEAKSVTGNKKLRMKDILEWTTGEIKPRDDEKIIRLPTALVGIAIKKE